MLSKEYWNYAKNRVWELNPEKCEVFFINANEVEDAKMYEEISKLLPGIRKIDNSTFELLGAPIFEKGLQRILSSKLESVELLSNRLKLLELHTALCIFKSSISKVQLPTSNMQNVFGSWFIGDSG